MKGSPFQLFAQEEEKVQAKADSIQMQEEKEEEELQMKAINAQLMKDASYTSQSSQIQLQEEEELQIKASSGNEGNTTQMPENVQTKMENSFGTDFSNVNIHKDSDQANIGALAYTQGNSVHFAPGQYKPGSQKGQELLGHELTHVVQQREGRVKPDTEQQKGLNINSDTSLEKEADDMGAKAAQGKMANVRGLGSEVQKREAPGTSPYDKVNETTIDYKTYKSKIHKASVKAKLYSLSEKDGNISVEKLYETKKNFAVESEIILKGLKVSIYETDQCYYLATKKNKEVAKIKIVDASNPDWNGRTVWTTRTNVSEQAGDDELYKIVKGDANVRADAGEVNGKQKQIPESTELLASEFKQKGSDYYLEVSDKETGVEYGWLKVDGFENNLENVSFGVTKASYVSEDKNHSTINRNSTKTYEEDGYKYSYIKENDQYVLIPLNSKVKIIETAGSYAQVEGMDGDLIGWTSKSNLATKAADEGYYEVTNDDARLRRKERNFKAKSSKLSVGTYVIEKELSLETYPEGEYAKVALTEKKDDNYVEKADSEVWVQSDHLTGKWADVKGKHATWDKGVYTGQIDLVNVMGTKDEMEYMKADTNNEDNDMYVKYKEMADAAEGDGVIIGLVDGFRTYPEQKFLRAAYLAEQKKIATGTLKKENKKYKLAAKPGRSKHEIGIAIDLNNNKNTSVNTWMMKNAYKYGFVRPLDKGFEEAHHWEYHPDQIRKPKQIKKEEGGKEVTNTRYYFGSFSLNKDKEWKAYKWKSNCYDE